MFDFLNKFGLPVKYAIMGAVGGVLGVFLANAFDFSNDAISYTMTPIVTAIGGAIGGWLRQRKGKVN